MFAILPVSKARVNNLIFSDNVNILYIINTCSAFVIALDV